MYPEPQGNDLFRIWGFSDGSFYAVGEAGTVVRYDGAFTLENTPTREDLHGVWAAGPNDIYACGTHGALIHFDGSKWRNVDAHTTEDLYAVWGSASDDIFLAGTTGRVLNLHAGTRTVYMVAPDRRLRALWGYSHNEVYVSGSTGALYRFDGNSWTRMIIFGDPYLDADIYDLWGPAPGSISLVDRFNILWFNGTWNGVSLRPSNGLGLWGFALNQQIAVSSGASQHLTGTSVTLFDAQTREALFDIWGESMSDCYAVGRSGSIEHFDGASWQAMNDERLYDLIDVNVSATGAVALGTGGTILRQSGSAWVEENVSTNYEFSGIWQTNGLSVAVGRYAPNNIDWRQAILTNTGGGWTDVGPVGLAQRLFDVWGSSASDTYAVGWAGEILHYDGIQWGVVDSGSGDAAFLLSVSGTGPDDIVAVGRTNSRHALICTFDGNTWTKRSLSGVEELRGVWADGRGGAFAVGSGGAIRRRANGSWSSMSSPTNDELFCVFGSSASDVYAGGWQGALIHYDGTAWQSLLPATNRSIHAISGLSATDIFLVGDRGSIWHFAGLANQVASQ
jgi:hypothetical protein